jgi:hypothetical protein
MANIELDGTNKKIKVDSGDLTLDVPGDIILDADGADLVFADGGTNILKVTNSSSDVVLQPQVDAKDIIFKQYDGTTVATVEDNGTFNVPTSKLAINGTAITSTAAEINLIDGGTARGTTAIADGDGVLINDAGTMRMTNVTTLKTYMGVGDNTPAFRVNKSSTQAIAHDTEVEMTWQDEILDTDSAFASNRFTPQTAGYYQIYASARLNTNSDADQWRVQIHKNGSQFAIGSMVNRTQQTGQCLAMVELNGSTDYVSAYAYHVVGSESDIEAQDTYTYFQGFKLIGLV